MICIYALSDPRSPSSIRYIGKAKCLKHRLRGHIGKARRGESKSHCGNWIRVLLRDGVKPHMTPLYWVSENEWQETERKTIQRYRAMGHDLTNVNEGGEGSSMEPDTRQKLSIAFKGRKISQGTREKISAANRGRKHSKETKLKIARAHTKLERVAWSFKGRATGEQHGNAKLTAQDVLAIRASNETSTMLAERYRISRTHAANIKSGKSGRT